MMLNVIAYLQAIEDEGKRKDALQVLKMMTEITQEKPVLWGGSIIGFGTYHYKYASGREGDWFLTGFSPRKQALTLYIMSGFSRYDDLMEQLGKFKTRKIVSLRKAFSRYRFNYFREAHP